MKKKLLALFLAMSMTLTLCACGSDKEGADAEKTESDAGKTGVVSTRDYNSEDYVTVGDYSGIEVTVDVVNYTEEDVETQFQDEVEYYIDYSDLYVYTPTDKTEIEDGDVVNIDYVGKKDGVAFDGGTAEGHNLEIGSGSFIDGFEEGLIGHKVGETTTLNLTFPEEYHSEELAGADVTFDVTINAINTKEMPEITDELIAQMDIGFDSVEALKEDVRAYLQESCDDTNTSEKETKVWDAVYETCTISDPPQEMVDDIKATITQNAETYASYYGVSMDEFVTTYMGYTMEEYEAECETSAIENAKQKLAVAAIAKQAGLEVTDEELKSLAEAQYEEYGYESADALLEEVGEGAYYDYILTDKVYQYLATCVTIKENEPVSILADADTGELEEAEESEEILEEENAVLEDGAEEDASDDDLTGDLILQTE